MKPSLRAFFIAFHAMALIALAIMALGFVALDIPFLATVTVVSFAIPFAGIRHALIAND